MVPTKRPFAYPLSEVHKSLLDEAKTKERFWKKVNKTARCWEWTGSKNYRGYGQFCIVRISKCQAHRISMYYAGKEVPSDMSVDHLCRNPACVNPAHLEICDLRTNILRGFGVTAENHRKTHCVHGHPLFGENLRWAKDEKGLMTKRCCRTCSGATRLIRDSGRTVRKQPRA